MQDKSIPTTDQIKKILLEQRISILQDQVESMERQIEALEAELDNVVNSSEDLEEPPESFRPEPK